MSISFSFPSLSLLISLFAFASLLASHTLSTSLDNTLETTGFAATLSHVDQGKSLTKTELLRRGIQRGEKRMSHLESPSPSPSQSPQRSNIRAPTRGSNGQFFMTFAIGTPSVNHSVIVDTDTDLIWINKCNKYSTSYSKLSYYSEICQNTESNNKKGGCQYRYQYNSYNKVPVDLATESFTFGDVKLSKLAFSCNVSVQKPGAVGLGRGPVSLISQMNANKFSYCLPPYDNTNETGVVLVGPQVKSYRKMITTSLVTNDFFTSKYYINVTGLTVGNVRLPIDPSSFKINPIDGTGGVVMDTGCTVTYLEHSVFDKVQKEVSKQITNQTKLRTISDYTELPVCFTIPPNSEKTFKYPTITFHLGGTAGKAAELVLSIDNTYREYTEGKINITCLAMKPAVLSDRGMSSLGNIQQQNTLVVFDLHKQTIAFRPNTECYKM